MHYIVVIMAASLLTSPLFAEKEAADAPTEPEPQAVKLPGIAIDVENKRIDIDAKVSLSTGLLELVACLKDSKEHESIVVVDAAPTHIHAALLIIGAKNGHPAMIKPTNPERTEWVELPPRGDKIRVSLVVKDQDGEAVDRPIGDFIRRTRGEPGFDGQGRPIEENAGDDQPAEEKHEKDDPFDYFLFAGSRVHVNDAGKKQYLADVNGHVVSLSTFGDEVICLPERISSENAALIWEVDPTHLPKVGTKVTLRLSLVQAKPKQGETEGETSQPAPDDSADPEGE